MTTYEIPCIECKTKILATAIFDLIHDDSLEFSCPYCGKKNKIAFGHESLEIGLNDGWSSGFGSSFDKKSEVQIPGLKVERISEPLKVGLQITLNNQKWFLKSDLSLYQAIQTGSDENFVFYEYSVDFVKTAKVKVHRKKGTIEQVEDFTPDGNPPHMSFTDGFKAQVKGSEPPLFLQWLGPKD